jgi:hypothetical protein
MAVSKLNPSAGGIPFGNTAGRPTAATGKLYSNGETARLELYTATGWQNIVQETPAVTSITGTYSEYANLGTISIYGTNFVDGAIATAIGTNGSQVNASSTTYNSLVQLTAVFTNLSNAYEPYDIKVTNPSNLFGIIPDALYINASAVWVTSSGSLGTFNEQVSISVSATATDSDSTITYALASGSTLPSGVTLNSSTGLISGTLPAITANTTYTFTINASDGLNIIPRTFSITSADIVAIDYLVIAGGGGGAGAETSQGGGGGGAGGLRSSFTTTGGGGSLESPMLITKNINYAVTVGLGGNGGSPTNWGSDGNNSIFSTITSVGGGGGAPTDRDGRSGGSGGGSGSGGVSKSGGAGTANQGYAGGNNPSSPYHASGGGGAGAVGVNGGGGTGNGGAGVAVSITGSSVTYAGGGGGGTHDQSRTPGTGGSGGGGNAGAFGTNNGSAGTANLGGGGGGASGPATGGAGGAGVVILRYLTSDGTITIGSGLTGSNTTNGLYKITTLTSGSGNVSWS